MEFLLESSFYFAVLRSATPIIFATLAAIIADKAGLLNMAIEGTMLVAALGGVIGSAYSQSIFVGLLIGLVCGVVYSLILAYCILNLKTNDVITGVALNLAAAGGTVFFLDAICGDKSVSSSLKSLTFPTVNIPVLDKLDFLGGALSGHNVLKYVAIIAVILLHIMLKKTGLGIKIRAVGENEEAASSVGISTTKIRYISLIFSGILSSLGGMFLSMGYVSMFTANMTAGRGFIALATSAMASSNPIGGLVCSLIYACGDTVANFMQNSVKQLDIMKLMPYLFIIIIFAVFSYKKKKDSKEVSEI